MAKNALVGLTLIVWLALGFVVAVFVVAPAFDSDRSVPDDRPYTVKVFVPTNE